MKKLILLFCLMSCANTIAPDDSYDGLELKDREGNYYKLVHSYGTLYEIEEINDLFIF